MNPMFSIIVILAITAQGQCENNKRDVYVENAGLNTGVVFSSGLSSHDSFGQVNVASSHSGLPLTSAGHGSMIVPGHGGVTYGSGLNYGPTYRYASHSGGNGGVHYESVNIAGNYGSGIVHSSAGVGHGLVNGVNVAQGVNYGSGVVSNQVFVTNGIAHQGVQAHQIYPSGQLTRTIPVAPQTVHVPVNQHYPVNVHQPVAIHYEKPYHVAQQVPVGVHQPVQMVGAVHAVSHQPIGSQVGSLQVSSTGHALSSAVSGLSLDHVHGPAYPSQSSVYYAGQGGFAGPQNWVH